MPLADTAEVPEVGELLAAVPPPEGEGGAGAETSKDASVVSLPDGLSSSSVPVEVVATEAVPIVTPPQPAGPPPEGGGELDVSRAGRLALRHARRQRHLWAAAGIAVLMLVLAATVLIVGVVR